MSQEVELKIKVDTEQEDILKHWLQQNGIFVATESQSDIYFLKPDEQAQDSITTLRIRKKLVGDHVTNLLCYKRRYDDPDTGRRTHREEYETEVSDPETTKKLLIALGYTKQVLIEKRRDIFLYDNLEVSFDDFPAFGLYIEIELKNTHLEPAQGLKIIEQFLIDRGISEFIQLDTFNLNHLDDPKNSGFKRSLSH